MDTKVRTFVSIYLLLTLLYLVILIIDNIW